MYRIGLGLTGSYLLGLVAFIWVDWGNFSTLKMNEWGDFLAGFVGPVALIWIVLSFMLQSKELRASVKALELQAKEMKNSVAQQEKMVQATYDTLEHDRFVLKQREIQRKSAAQPTLQITLGAGIGRGDKLFRHEFKVLNTGNPCTRFRATLFQDNNLVFDAVSDYFKNGETISRQHNEYLPRWEKNLSAEISYTDNDGDGHTKIYRFDVIETDNGWPKYSVSEQG